MKITATIITLNEENNIRDCVLSAQQICDEVVVLDSKSTDNTCHLARELGAKVIEQEYLGDGPQKACAASYASFDWVLSIDADERIDDQMLDSIRALNLSETGIDRYAFSRKTYIGDTWIKVWYPDYVIRLYNRKVAEYESKMGHAKVVGGRLATLQGNVLHYSFEDYIDLARTTVKFSERGAKMFVDKGKRIGMFSPLAHGLAAFIRKFVFKKGILYGEPGFTVSLMTAFGTYLKYQTARKMNQKKAE